MPLTDGIDHEEEIRKLEEELAYTEGFLASVIQKLSNEKFVANAPGKGYHAGKEEGGGCAVEDSHAQGEPRPPAGQSIAQGAEHRAHKERSDAVPPQREGKGSQTKSS